MNSIRTIVHDGGIDIHVAADLPEGTEVEVRILPISAEHKPGDGDWDDSPEGIEAWIGAIRTLEPLQVTPAELAAWEATKAEQKRCDKERFFERGDQLAKDLG